MDRKKIAIISTVVVLILLVLLLFLFLILFRKEEVEVPEPKVEEPQNSIVEQLEKLPPPSEERIKDDNDYPLGLKQLAMSYAERFSSYSSDANFKNLSDLETLSTAKMKASIDEFISNSNLSTDNYEAVEARALNSKLIYLTDNEAVIVVSLQINKFESDKLNFETSYSKIELKLVNVNNQWFVDEAKLQ